MVGRGLTFLMSGALVACSSLDAPVAANAAADTSSQNPAPTSPAPLSAIDALDGTIKATFSDAARSATDRSAREVEAMIKAHVDADLVKNATGLEGRDLRVTLADGASRHVGVIAVRFADVATAKARGTKIMAMREAYLERTKILTPLVAVQAGPVVAIFYTESGGDPRMMEVLTKASRAFAEGQATLP